MKKQLFKNSFLSLLLGALLFSLAACSGNPSGPASSPASDATNAPFYERSMTPFSLPEDANSYWMDFSQDGFFYYVQAQETEQETPAYQFYYQPYGAGEGTPFCEVTGGIVRDFSGAAQGDVRRLSVLTVGDRAGILEFDGSSEPSRELLLDETFHTLESPARLLFLPGGGYLIGLADQLFFLDQDGKTTGSLKPEGSVSQWILTGDQELFVVIRRSESGKGRALQCLTRLDLAKKQVQLTTDLPDDLLGIFAFEDGLLSVFGDRVVFSHPGAADEKVLIDLNRQSLLASQIRTILGSREEILIVSATQEQGGYFISLKERSAQSAENQEKSDAQLYAPDGRRIVRVAVPQQYYYQIEFHVRKYNQTSEKAFVEVERFQDSPETYLGKGNRPDILMLSDQTQLDAYLEKNALVDLLPLFADQQQYSLDDILPKARELLGAGEGGKMYAMAGRFRLLLRTSDGTEFDDGACDAIRYLNWYDNYLTENEINGMGALENFLYANVSAFYDETTASASFTSESFRQLMQLYRDVCTRHQGAADLSALLSEKGYTAQEIVTGPRWLASYRCYQLTEPGTTMEGIPAADGKGHVYMRLDYPMSILSTCECRKEALDFLLYYNSQEILLMKGESEGDYGKSGNTMAIFSVYEEHMKHQIYESEKPYSSLGSEECYYTPEQCEHLKELIDSAVSDSAAQREIYAMLLEEMTPYLQGGKDLGSACEVLQSRATLYLKEQK